MAASDKQRLKLEKDFLNAKNKEAAVEKQINALLEKGKDLLDEDVMTLDEKLEKLKQITASSFCIMPIGFPSSIIIIGLINSSVIPSS